MLRCEIMHVKVGSFGIPVYFDNDDALCWRSSFSDYCTDVKAVMIKK